MFKGILLGLVTALVQVCLLSFTKDIGTDIPDTRHAKKIPLY
jgi:hypothetical protein